MAKNGGSQLILATNMATTPSDRPSLAATILAMEHTIGVPHTVLADAGFASGAAAAKLEAKHVEPPVAIATTQLHRPAPGPVLRLPIAAQAATRAPHPGALALRDEGETRESKEGKSRYRKRKQTVEPIFGIG